MAPGATTYTSTSPQYVTGQQTYTTTTTTGPQYVGGQTYTSGSGAVAGQTYTTATTGQAAYGSTLQAGSGVRRAVAEEIPVESRIEYIPFEKKYVEYEQVEKVYQVPVETEVVEYEEVVRNERIPVERTITDYYAVETQVEYIRREIEETVMVEEPVEKVSERIQYIPVETQIVHYPERDNYVAAPTKTRTEYVGVVEGGSGVHHTSAVQGGTYVTGGSGVNTQQVAYQTQAVPAATTYTTTTTQPAAYTSYSTGGQQYATSTGGQQYATSSYTTGGQVANSGYTAHQSYQPGATYTTTTGGYVTGGSGVRAASGYVTGGSGVRGSGVKQTYETTYHA